LLGTINSLVTSFKPSAIGCNKPQKPTTFGPLRRWIAAIILRSANVKKATEIINGIMRIKESIKVFIIIFNNIKPTKSYYHIYFKIDGFNFGHA
jgi:hypothetical protein